MNDIVMTSVVVVVLMLLVAIRASGYARDMRRWLWVALAEFLGSSIFQYYNGADANGYRDSGTEIARMLDASFGWAWSEALALLLQQPNAFEDVSFGSGTNTGSMCAAAGWVLFFVRGSPYAAQALVAGLSMLGAFSVYEACRDAHPEGAPFRLFAATVLFPSVAFWTAALHKEAFCLMGMGLLFAGWRAALARKLRALVYVPLGFGCVAMFRAPALPPIVLGFVIHFVLTRSEKARGAVNLARPIYILGGLAVMALAMIVVGRLSPDFAVDRIGETVAVRQGSWRALDDAGGSAFGVDDAVTQSLGGQILTAPIAFLNASLRPQFFDVTSPVVAVSALEMTFLTWLIVSAVSRHRFAGTLLAIQRAPFLAMCVVITVVGLTFVGLTTRNFGTLARYRVPFLPFYGALLACLTQPTAARAPAAPKAPKPLRNRTRRRPEPTVAPTA
jgi:hypothetical protein